MLVSQGSSQVLAVCTLDNLFPSEPRNAINIIPDLSRLGNDWSGKRHSAQERIDACVSQTVLAREASRSMITPRIPTTPTRPTIDKFPLAVKIDCDVLADDGGTVPLSVTANSLVMRAAGVPLGKPVAGVQVGLLAPADEVCGGLWGTRSTPCQHRGQHRVNTVVNTRGQHVFNTVVNTRGQHRGQHVFNSPNQLTQPYRVLPCLRRSWSSTPPT